MTRDHFIERLIDHLRGSYDEEQAIFQLSEDDVEDVRERLGHFFDDTILALPPQARSA